jgi:DNA topoisomerase-3
MTPQAIRDGFAHLRSDNDMQPLADAARCRSEADSSASTARAR